MLASPVRAGSGSHRLSLLFAHTVLLACGSQNRARSDEDRPPRAACESRRLEAKAGPKGMRLRAGVAAPHPGHPR